MLFLNSKVGKTFPSHKFLNLKAMKPSLFQRLRYNFENALSKGSGTVILYLAIATLLFTIISAAIVMLIDVIIGVEEGMSFPAALHETFYQMLSPGAIDWENSIHFRIIMAVLCLVSLLVASILIGLISSNIEGKIEELRRGRSALLEKNHIVIYGWSSKIFPIIQQLIYANSNRKKCTIAIMSGLDKVDMEEMIREKIENFQTSNVIVRSGLPTDIEDINLMRPQDARSIIVLPDGSEQEDMNVVKTLMAIVNNPKRKSGKYSIITEINDGNKKEVAEIVAGAETTIIQTSDTISRLMVQTCLQPGLSIVYNEFLSFEGVEVYFTPYKSSYGKKFHEVIYSFENAVVLGFIDKNGKSTLCPNPDVDVPEGAQLVCLAADDQHFTPRITKNPVYELVQPLSEHITTVEKMLIIGWNAKIPTILRELDSYAHVGSQVCIMCCREEVQPKAEALQKELINTTIDLHIGDTTNSQFLMSVELEKFDHVLILSYDHVSEQDADSYTLITLIQLRNLSDKLGAKFNIVSEMLDLRNKTLAELAKPDDFIIGDNITSLILSQLTENPKLIGIYKELFSASGAEMYLRPIQQYVQTGISVDFNTLTEAAIRHSEVALGYRTAKLKENFGVVLNPEKSKQETFQENDMLIVLSK